jgi:hypothetical protein
MVGQPSHGKQLSLNHVCKIGLNVAGSFKMSRMSCQKIWREILKCRDCPASKNGGNVRSRKNGGKFKFSIKNGPTEQTEEVSTAAAGHLARLAH